MARKMSGVEKLLYTSNTKFKPQLQTFSYNFIQDKFDEKQLEVEVTLGLTLNSLTFPVEIEIELNQFIKTINAEYSDIDDVYLERLRFLANGVENLIKEEYPDYCNGVKYAFDKEVIKNWY